MCVITSGNRLACGLLPSLAMTIAQIKNRSTDPCLSVSTASLDNQVMWNLFGFLAFSITENLFAQSSEKTIRKEKEEMARTILVTAGTGKIAQYLIPLLSQAGVRVKALVHSQRGADEVGEHGVEPIVGDFFDDHSVRQAVQGVDSIMLITPAASDSVEMVNQVLAAAKRAESPHIVRLSVLNAAPDAPSDNARQHYYGELAVRRSGLPWTILRPNFFMQNLLASAGSIASEGKLVYGMGDGRIGMIDARDIAEAAFAVLTGGDHDGKTYSLTGPEAISMHTVAGALGNALDSNVQYTPVAPEQISATLKNYGLGDWYAQTMADYQRAYESGWGEIVTEDIPNLCAHPARSIEQFAHEIFAPAVVVTSH